MTQDAAETMSDGARGQANWLGAHSPVVLSRLMRRFADENLSGDLQVVSGNSVKTVRVDRGQVRFAASNLRQDRLGESMLAHEFIDEGLFALASETMREEGCRFGEALLKLGHVTEKQLHKELAVQVQRIVLSLFRVKEGLYTFDARELESDAALPFGLSLPPLLLKGLRRVTDEGQLLEALPPADTRVRVSRSPLYAFDPTKLSSLERWVLEEAGDDGTSIGEILGAASEDRSATLRSCYALMTVGLLEPIPDDVELLGPAASPVAAIEQQFESLGRSSDAELLRVNEEDSREAVELAYERARDHWREVRAQTHEATLLERLDEIDRRVDAAHSRLVAEKDHECVAAELVDEPGASDAISELQSLVGELADVDVEDPPAARKPPPNATGRFADDEELPDPVKLPAIAKPMDATARHARRRQFERDARLHLQVKDYRGAVPLLRELVSLEPERAQFRAMLGQAMQHHPSTVKNAEHHFLEAVRLAPRDVKLHLALAVYYKRTGKRGRAATTLEKVLALDPSNEKARQYLLAHGENTSVKSLVKKIFG